MQEYIKSLEHQLDVQNELIELLFFTGMLPNFLTTSEHTLKSYRNALVNVLMKS